MTITLDAVTEQLLKRELDRRSFTTPDEAVACAVRLLAHQDDDWLLRNRDAINAALDETFAQAGRGEGHSPEESRVHFAESRAAHRPKAA